MNAGTINIVIPYLIAFVLAYLFGSISIARLVVRLMAPDANLEQVELPDRNTGGTFTLKTTGATTASLLLGPRVGGMIGVLDILKGLLPTLVTRLVFPDQPLYLVVGLAAVAGHIWPVYYRFHGGGGLSPALGVCLVINPIGTLVCVVIAFLLGFFVFKEIVVIVMGGTWLLIPWVWLWRGSLFEILALLLLNIMLVLAVLPDVKVQLQAAKAGKTDMSTSMDVIPMGRMMKKMMQRFGAKAEQRLAADDDQAAPLP